MCIRINTVKRPRPVIQRRPPRNGPPGVRVWPPGSEAALTERPHPLFGAPTTSRPATTDRLTPPAVRAHLVATSAPWTRSAEGLEIDSSLRWRRSLVPQSGQQQMEDGTDAESQLPVAGGPPPQLLVAEGWECVHCS